MYGHKKDQSFVIQISETPTSLLPRPQQQLQATRRTASAKNKLLINDFSAMKVFNRFRKIFMKLVFSFPSSSSSRAASGTRTSSSSSPVGAVPSSSVPRRRSCDTASETPKASFSSNSYYSTTSHYSEAIADCIEFINKSSCNSKDSNKNQGYHCATNPDDIV